MSRVTRNTIGVVKSNGNNILGEKNSNIPIPSKRKAEVGLKKESKTRKRAALGDLTNALTEKPSNGASNIKNQVKKGLNNFVGKGKSSIRVKELKTVNKKVVAKVKDEAEIKNPEQGTSSSSEEGLLCILDSSDTSNDVTVKEEEVEIVYEIKEPARKTPPEGVLDFDLETLRDPQQHSEYVMETFKYYKVSSVSPVFISKLFFVGSRGCFPSERLHDCPDGDHRVDEGHPGGLAGRGPGMALHGGVF